MHPHIHGNGDCKDPTIARCKFDPKWEQGPGSSTAPSQEFDEKGYNRTKIYDPISAVAVPNYGQGDEYMIGTWFSSNHGGGLPEILSYSPGTRGYSTEHIPHDILTKPDGPQSSHGHGTVAKGQPLRFPGIGRVAHDLIFAGGMYGTGICQPEMEEIGKVWTFCSKSRSTRMFEDELETKRQAPVVGGSPDGKYVIVAGGIHHVAEGHQKRGELLTSVEIFDRESGRLLKDSEIDRIFGCKARKEDSIRELPSPRIGGHCVWIQNEEINRIFFIGGSSGPEHHQQTNTLGDSEPTKLIDCYDVNAQKWLDPIEILTPRNFPGVATRDLGDGTQDIVITGGSTGRRVGSHNNNFIRPVLSTEILDPANLTLSMGHGLHSQKPIRNAEWDYKHAGPVALAIRSLLEDRSQQNTQQGDKGNCACRGAIQAAAFGFNFAQVAKLSGTCGDSHEHTAHPQ
jgi:hypothetical protein